MDDDVGGDAAGGGALQAARGRVVSQVVKKNLIQNAVPIFIELKRLLESKNSPLIGSLMECLRVLLKDYKNEFEEILVADKQLQKELMYDMKKYENAKAKSAVEEAVASARKLSIAAGVASTSGFRSPLACTGSIYAKVSERLGTGGEIGSAVAAAAARATARSVLKEVNMNAAAPTPPLGSMSVPKLKSGMGGGGVVDRRAEVLESVRRRQDFDTDDVD